MADVGKLGHLISKFVNYQALNAKQQQMSQNQPAKQAFAPQPTPQPTSNAPKMSPTPQMANMAGMEQSAYVKDLSLIHI